MTYYCEYKRGARIRLGRVGIMSPSNAREAASKILLQQLSGEDPAAIRKAKRPSANWGTFLDDHDEPWVAVNHKANASTMKRLRTAFAEFLDKPMSAITPVEVDRWRTARLKSDRKATTINRDLGALKASLNRAVGWGLLRENPLAPVKRLRVDSQPKVRYLSPDEEARLRDALDEREKVAIDKRASANVWREERRYALLPDLSDQAFIDHLRPMVLLSVNTGLRRGELFQLIWANVDLDQAVLTVEGFTAKSSKTRHVYLNLEAVEILRNWRVMCSDHQSLVFPGAGGAEFTHTRRSWERVLRLAAISNFRWHDLRHHFASKLAMAGVDLNTIRELLGHSDYAMTLRYAHLAPNHKRRSVELLNAPGLAV